MSGLSHAEMEGCRNLLGLLNNDEILALCDTITNRLVQPEDRQGKGRPYSPKAAGPSHASPVPSLRERVSAGPPGPCLQPARDRAGAEP